MYHADEPARVVKSQEELEELGDEWVESPTAAVRKPAAQALATTPAETAPAETDAGEKPDEDKKPRKGK
jgi:hypothetical protein